MTEFGSVMLLSVTLRPGMTVVRTAVSTLSAMTQPRRCSTVSTRGPFVMTCTHSRTVHVSVPITHQTWVGLTSSHRQAGPVFYPLLLPWPGPAGSAAQWLTEAKLASGDGSWRRKAI